MQKKKAPVLFDFIFEELLVRNPLSKKGRSLYPDSMKKKVLNIRPTQMALGLKEVDYRLQKILKMKPKELEDYLHERRVPVVLGPDGVVYAVDHHHLLRSCWEAQVPDVPVEQLADLSKKSTKDFWAELHKSNWVYPYDQFGAGPHDPVLLPVCIRGLADDPFRSLAWMVREKGGYQKTDILFAEFKWAKFFRENMHKQPLRDGFDQALQEALVLAAGPSAHGLPGFVGKKS